MIGARKVVRRAFGLMVPRTSQKMRRNEVYRWTNRLVWLVIVLLGGLREVIGTGRVLDGADRLFGAAAHWTLEIVPGYGGFLLALLPPGAFIGLGLLVALRNAIVARRQAGASRPAGNGA